MEAHFICPDCRASHDRPADARLGHLALCLDCSLAGDVDQTALALFTLADAQLAA